MTGFTSILAVPDKFTEWDLDDIDRTMVIFGACCERLLDYQDKFALFGDISTSPENSSIKPRLYEPRMVMARTLIETYGDNMFSDVVDLTRCSSDNFRDNIGPLSLTLVPFNYWGRPQSTATNDVLATPPGSAPFSPNGNTIGSKPLVGKSESYNIVGRNDHAMSRFHNDRFVFIGSAFLSYTLSKLVYCTYAGSSFDELHENWRTLIQKVHVRSLNVNMFVATDEPSPIDVNSKLAMTIPEFEAYIGKLVQDHGFDPIEQYIYSVFKPLLDADEAARQS